MMMPVPENSAAALARVALKSKYRPSTARSRCGKFSDRRRLTPNSRTLDQLGYSQRYQVRDSGNSTNVPRLSLRYISPLVSPFLLVKFEGYQDFRSKVQRATGLSAPMLVEIRSTCGLASTVKPPITFSMILPPSFRLKLPESLIRSSATARESF